MEDKTIVPLSSLVTDVYGSVKDKDIDYEANLKELQRIDKAIRGQSDYYVTQGIPVANRARFVNFFKKVIENPDIKKLIIKYDKNKTLNSDEFIKLHNFYIEVEQDANIKEKFMRTKKINEQMERIIVKEESIRKMIYCYFDEDCSDIVDKLLDQYEQKLDMIKEELVEECKKLSDEDDKRFFERLMRTYELYGSNINVKKIKSILEQN